MTRKVRLLAQCDPTEEGGLEGERPHVIEDGATGTIVHAGGSSSAATILQRVTQRRIILGAIIIRLGAALFLGNPYDFEIWKSTAVIVYSFHVNTYFWWSQGPLALIGILVSALPIPAFTALGLSLPIPLQNLCLHLFFIAGDLLVGYSLIRLVRGSGVRETAAWQKRSLLLWAILPGFWWIGASHGQTDTWIPATILLSVVYLHERRPVAAGIILGLGAGIIYVPLAVAPILAIYIVKRGGWRQGIILTVTTIGVFVTSMIPLLLTDLHIGPRQGLALFLHRNEWWSVAAQNTGTAGQGGLGSVVNSPFPVLLALAHHSGIAVRLVRDSPLLFAVIAIVVVPACYAVIRRSAPTGALGRHGVDGVLLACATTLLISGGLNTQAVVQRLYWSLPLLLVLAARCRSVAALAGTCIYSWLYLLPEFYTTPPTFYLRGPLRPYESNGILALFAGSWNGYGLFKAIAPVMGALVVPMGLLCLALLTPRSGSTRRAMSVAVRQTYLLRRTVAVLSSGRTLVGVLLFLIAVLIMRHEVMYVKVVLGLGLPAIAGVLVAALTFRSAGEQERMMRIAAGILMALSILIITIGPLGNTISQWWTG